MRFRELREGRGLLQKDVAEYLHCSVPVYCRYEKEDREPPYDVLTKLADFYGVSVDYILGRDMPPQEPQEPKCEIRTLARGGKHLTAEQIRKRNELILRLWDMDDEELDQAGRVIDIYHKGP